MKRCLCCAVLAVLVGASAASGETLSREERVIAYRLIGRLGDEDMDGQVCSEAITLLAQFGPKILPEIKRRLNTKDLVLRERLCAVLIQALNEDEPCPEAAPILRKQLVESLKRYATFAKSVSIHSVALEEAEKAAENAAKAAGESAPVRYYRVPTPGLRKPRRPADADNEVKKHMKRAEGHYVKMTEAMAKAAVCGRTIDLICGYFLHHAKPDDIAKFRHLYRKLGWDNVRAGRCKRLVELGLVKPGWKPTPRDKEVPAWKKAKHKDWEAERMAVFAAQVHGLDRNIGRILDALRESGVERNTLVFFLSDNGPSHQAWNRPLDKQGDPWRRDGVPTKCGNKPSIMPGGADTFVTYGRPWANVSATPFRGYKGAVDEGSTATPLIVRWPQTIAKGGTITHQVGHITDIMATCLEVARVPYPETFRGRTVLPLEGESLLPILQGRARPIRRPICWELRGHRAVRVGRWKLAGRKKQPWRLYDMEADRTEMHDVSANQPDRVRDMAAAFAQWRKG